MLVRCLGLKIDHHILGAAEAPMAISLLALSNGHLSLEFEPSDIDRVSVALRDLYGKPSVEKWPTLTNYRFSEASLVFQNEWDDPCLISGCTVGDEMLKRVASHLE